MTETPETPLPQALARDEVADLLRRRHYSRALTRCTDHLATFHDDQVLRLVRAETRCALADYVGAQQDADAVDSVRGAEDQARLHRVRGLIATDRREHDVAEAWFDTARALFESVGHHEGVAIVDRDKVMLGVRRGDPLAVAAALSAALSTPPRTAAERLLVAQALRRELRYEEALLVLLGVEDADPALLPVLRAEQDTLRWLIRADGADARPPAEPDSPRFDRRLHHTRLLVTDATELLARSRPAEAAVRVARAEAALRDLRSKADNSAERAAWHLCAGEVELARRDLLDRARATTAEVDSAACEAAAHLGRAARLADTTATAEVRLLALRLLGHTHVLLDAVDDAVESWRAAHRIEEDIAARQVSDEVRARMLLAAGDEHDERVRAAASAIDRHGRPAAAGVAVAIEAARGHTILDSIGGRWTAPPRLGDIVGARRWLRALSRDLPKSQLVWLMYADQERLHHVLVGRTVLHYYATPPRRSFRLHLTTAVETLTSFWEEKLLERSVRSGEFDDALAAVGTLLGIGPVVRALPDRVTRVAVVAHGVLSHVPVAALSTSDGGRLVHRFATSDLPSMTSRRPLALSSRRRRGERSLLISPDAPDLTATELRGRTTLSGADACPAMVRQAVPGHHIVRLDSHGQFADDDAWLQLSPDGQDGRLRPRDLRTFNLRDCGTVVLGACDSAMARTTGRDERVGFVRSAMHAGASAVVASRWIAEEPVAAGLLDQFERHLRHLPRDVALQRAQLDVCAGRTPHAGSPEHPARWACWALHGDAGWQTAAGPLRRLVRARRDDRSNSENKSPEGVPVLRR
jgi:hypothetical protein